MSGAARQHLILLLAGRYLSDDLFTKLCEEIENLFFAYVITREPTREFERKFAQWTKHLRTVHSKADLQEFLHGYFRPEKKRLAERFQLAMLQLREDSLQKYRLRYVLAKLTQYVNEEAWGAETQGDLEKFLDGTIHIEHVLPQNPSKEALAEFDKPEEADDYIGRLGNLTLAEEPINCSLGNQPFSAKRPVYKNSNFLLTRLLSGKVSVGKNTAVDRATDGFPIFDQWSSGTVSARQQSLATLAQQVWGMPQVLFV
jgi:hypothetical protein